MTNDDTALSLMRMALAQLDRSGRGATATAVHLQAAIDAASCWTTRGRFLLSLLHRVSEAALLGRVERARKRPDQQLARSGLVEGRA